MKRQCILAWNNLLLKWAWKPGVRQVNQIPRFFHAHRATYQRGNAATQLAKDICCARTHVHRIFCKDSIDIALLERISTALNYDFFHDLSEEFKAKV